MSHRTLVVKFGGEALASAELIARAAWRVRQRGAGRPVAVVVSARRGVTDHLLRLVRDVAEATYSEDLPPAGECFAADRALATGEVVSASLLALALCRLGVVAEPLDARESGLHSDASHSRARLGVIQPHRVRRLLDAGVVPVITGFQGWSRGRYTTLGRGGSDITAVELAASLGAECEFIKDTNGLESGDPRQVSRTHHIPQASHRFLRELARSGAKIIHPAAAAAAERHRVPLTFSPLTASGPGTTIVPGPVHGVAAVAHQGQRAVLHVEIPRTGDRAALGDLRTQLRAIDPGCEFTLFRDELGWKAQIALDVNECQNAGQIVRRGLPAAQLLAPCVGLAIVSLIGLEITPDILRRLSRAVTRCGTRITRSGHTGQRIWFVVPEGAAIAFQAELHAAFVERPAEIGVKEEVSL
ncbi:MAG: hypothetical protein ABI679_09065 [Gemmatimonadota bacterium]